VQKICLLCFYLVKNQVWGFQRWKGPLYLVAMGVLSVLIFIITLVPFPAEMALYPAEIHSYIFFTLLIMAITKALQFTYEKEINNNFYSLLPLSSLHLFMTKALYDIISPRNGIVLGMLLSFCLRNSSNLLIFILSFFYYTFIIVCVSIWLTNIFEFLRLMIPNLRQYVSYFLQVIFLIYFISLLIFKIDLDNLLEKNAMHIGLPLSALEYLFHASSVSRINFFGDFCLLIIIFVFGMVVGVFLTKLDPNVQ